ncbi:zinc finger protein 532-like [Melanaphis sacchari]|uniref:zinc finger protein 532-like n=1 Tax=Melanaphis sacchari TaxID=742174 RepID=UPI000DC1585F|nr:zinc finger protein 532-like [Melanaphis sacchari]
MFKCSVCEKVFTVKSNMLRHEKSHKQIKFSCGDCSQFFIRRDHLVNHVLKKHGFVKYGSEYNLAMGIAVGQQQQHQQSLSSVGIVDSVASTSNVNDSIPQQAPTPPAPSVKRANTNSARNIVKFKKARIGMVNTPGFIELDSALDRTVVWYYRGNTENCVSYQAFLESIKLELIEKINYCVRINPIKYNLKLESVYAHREYNRGQSF